MQPNPPQTDPQSQAAVNAQPAVPGAGQTVPPESVVPGADVYAMDGKKVGTVREVYNDSFLVHRESFFRHDYYIPYRYVAGVSNDEVNLTLMSHEAQGQNWSQRPGAAPGAQTVPPSQPGQHGTNPTAGSMAPPSPQTSPDYGTDYGAQQGGTALAQDQTSPYDDYGRAGSSGSPLNIGPNQSDSDVEGARDL